MEFKFYPNLHGVLPSALLKLLLLREILGKGKCNYEI
jgi:hypothetical protein